MYIKTGNWKGVLFNVTRVFIKRSKVLRKKGKTTRQEEINDEEKKRHVYGIQEGF